MTIEGSFKKSERICWRTLWCWFQWKQHMQYMSFYCKLLQTKLTSIKIMPFVRFNMELTLSKVLKCQPLYFKATVCNALWPHRHQFPYSRWNPVLKWDVLIPAQYLAQYTLLSRTLVLLINFFENKHSEEQDLI